MLSCRSWLWYYHAAERLIHWCAGPYKDTVNLPVTKFNMRANSVQREPELQRQWAAQRTYEQLRDGNSGVSSLPRLNGFEKCA
jgi:hypothetical protein